MFVPLTPLMFKQRAVQLFGRKVGVIDGDLRFTYAEFGERVDRLANALREMGLTPGGRVAFLSYNGYPLLEGYYGVLEAGGVLLPINIRLSPDDIAYILENSGADLLFADQDFVALVDAVLPRLTYPPRIVWLTGVPLGREGVLYGDLIAQASPDSPSTLAIDENEVAELFYTSGTTGRPKGVMLTHRNLTLHALFCAVAHEVTDADVQLHTIPLFHVNGWGTPQYLTGVGGTHVMMRRFDPGEALRLIERERVTRFLAVPTMLNMLLNRPDLNEHDLSSLTLITLGGAPAPPEMVRRAENLLGCPVISGYGLSETTPVLTFATDKAYVKETEDERIERQASAGLPNIGVQIGLLDPDGRELDWDGQSVGEICARSNIVMKGYWRDEEATRAVLHDDWFHTGDIGTVDLEGYVHIVDRAKDIIISGGENISSAEIEKVIFEHPAVLEVAVIAIPDEEWGEVPAALVTLKPDASASGEDITEFCRERLARFKVPRVVEFRDALPKGGTGKILKRELREPFWQGIGRRVH